MFFGVRINRDVDMKSKCFYLFFIPIYKKTKINGKIKKYILGLSFYKETGSHIYVGNSTLENIVNDRLLWHLENIVNDRLWHLDNKLRLVDDKVYELELLIRTISSNLRDLKRSENKLIVDK